MNEEEIEFENLPAQGSSDLPGLGVRRSLVFGPSMSSSGEGPPKEDHSIFKKIGYGLTLDYEKLLEILLNLLNDILVPLKDKIHHPVDMVLDHMNELHHMISKLDYARKYILKKVNVQEVQIRELHSRLVALRDLALSGEASDHVRYKKDGISEEFWGILYPDDLSIVIAALRDLNCTQSLDEHQEDIEANTRIHSPSLF